jgi:HSP20 family molecular chaperone IbpA
MFALTPREKVSPLARVEYPLLWMEERFPTLFKRLFEGWPLIEAPEWEPRWEMTTEETEKEYVVRAELPGFEPSEVKVEVTGELLTVEAEHREPAEKKEEKVEKPVRYAHVKRTITLPPTIDLEKAEAVYKNGLLEIRLPRKPEAMGRRIEVKN